ncbi:sigma-54-dependent Fis family transcriptional regulator [Candidatus Poribacteria bacterium]|nr:sigma-54-dependent Fis family transcriptional regulator [Candidatus Poribacteria bacterium]
MPKKMTKNLEPSISIIVADDEPSIRKTVSRRLQQMGYDVRTCSDGRECLKAFKESAADIVITDLSMPEVDGLTVLRRIKELSPSTEVIIITAFADKDIAIEALRMGAHDFLEKPFTLDALESAIKRTTRYQAVLRERDHLAEQLSMISDREAERWGISGFIGKSETVQKILKNISLLQATETTSVLIQGESGTGKELIARAIHFGGPRASSPFVPVNCSTIPGELAESTLFGHIRGAFTGANASRKGYFELASGGTLFLDEICDMPLELQPKLLRVLEEGYITPVGSIQERHINTRILTATNANIQERMANGLFREDLYFRLARFRVKVPPLRDRKEDIPLLAHHFVNFFATEMGINPHPLNPDVLEILASYHFPGNVRELKNVIEGALIESGKAEVQLEHLHFTHAVSHDNSISITSAPTSESDSELANLEMPLNLREAEKILIKRALARAEGNVSAAARLLGISRNKLYRQLIQEESHIS